MVLGAEGAGWEIVWSAATRRRFLPCRSLTPYRGGAMHLPFVVSGENKMMVVEVATQPAFTASKPSELFQGRYLMYGPRAAYDVTADGQRFLMLKVETSVAQLNVVMDWFEELKRMAPAGKN